MSMEQNTKKSAEDRAAGEEDAGATRPRQPSFIAYHVRDGKTAFWDRVGVAWANRDGGFTVQLHAVPLSGRIVLRKPEMKN